MTKQAEQILRYWQAAEYMAPIDLKPFLRRSGVRFLNPDQPLPWTKPASQNCYYLVLLGLFDLKDVLLKVRQWLKEGAPPVEDPTGATCMAAFRLDQRGMRRAGSYGLASLPWALGRLMQAREGALPRLDGFSAAAAEATERFDAEAKNQTERLTFGDLAKELAWVCQFTGWSPDQFERTAVTLFVSERGETEDLSDQDLMNSFVARDLGRVAEACGQGRYGRALRQYLGEEPVGTRHDLRQSRAALQAASAPGMLPAGRWPGKGDYPLYLAQQVSVNLAIHTTAGSGGLFTVNGPPGTGKSTLLRDIVAAAVVERAKEMIRFTTPQDAFRKIGTIERNGHTLPVWGVDDRLRGHEIVVASANNGAVENVTREMPRADAIDKSWWAEDGADFLRQVGTNVLGEPAWALIAAALGNKANRNQFVSRFWFDRNEADSDRGSIKRVLSRAASGQAAEGWQRASKLFRQSLQEFEETQEKLSRVHAVLEEHTSLSQRVQSAAKQAEQALAQFTAAQQGLGRARLRHEQSEAEERTARYNVEQWQVHRPNWLARLFRTKAYRHWKYQDDQYREALFVGRRTVLTRSSELESAQRHSADLGRSYHSGQAEYDSARRQLDAANDLLAKHKQELGDRLPDDQFWSLPEQDWQRIAPWQSTSLHRVRAQVFLRALAVHQSFLSAARDRVQGNLGLMADLLLGELPTYNNEAFIPHLWSTLFMAVPVVSTTFASFDRLFRGLGSESLGWVLIDEAGQASPQAGAGAIWRARRALVIGDPLQLEPVIAMPEALLKLLQEGYRVPVQVNPLAGSAQTLADDANAWGARVGPAGSETWAGSPLRVHSRCLDPMFQIANAIAYGGMMVQGTVDNGSGAPFGDSCWYHVRSQVAEENWIPAEGEVVLELLKEAGRAANGLPELYVISPFKSASEKMRDMLRQRSGEWVPTVPEKEVQQWILSSVGTVHTFQGKEAPAVILLLGGNPAKPGARAWAAKKPNLLNVALTRAKRRVYVVGDYEAWRQLPNFNQLARALGASVYGGRCN